MGEVFKSLAGSALLDREQYTLSRQWRRLELLCGKLLSQPEVR